MKPLQKKPSNYQLLSIEMPRSNAGYFFVTSSNASGNIVATVYPDSSGLGSTVVRMAAIKNVFCF